jgi:hypothetical protein
MFSAGVFWSRCCEWIAVGLSFVSGKECEATRVGEMNNEPGCVRARQAERGPRVPPVSASQQWHMVAVLAK